MPKRARWSAEIKLRGAGGEPVDFARTLLSHGVADLPPNRVAPDGSGLQTVLAADGRAWPVELSSPRPGLAVATLSDDAADAARCGQRVAAGPAAGDAAPR